MSGPERQRPGDGASPPLAPEAEGRSGLGEIAGLFLKLGVIAFGGPAAHIAMMEDEVVERRRWLSRQHFLDLIGATNLIPGPNSTEMTMHVGYERGGWRGLFVAGACFIGPAVLLTGLAAWAYVRYGSVPAVEPLLYGIKPAVLAVIAGALWKLGKKAITGWPLAVLAALVAAAVLAGVGEVWALLAGGIAGALALKATGARGSGRAARWIPILFLQTGAASGAGGAASASRWPSCSSSFSKSARSSTARATSSSPSSKAGSWTTWAGSRKASCWTPSPSGSSPRGRCSRRPRSSASSSSAWAARPSRRSASFCRRSCSWAALNPLIPKLRQSAWLSAFLDAVNAASVALMLAVTLQLGFDVLVSWPAWVIAAGAAVAVLRFRTNAAWIVLAGAVLGWMLAPWA